MRLILLHPELAARSCDDCETWLYQENGMISKRRDGSGGWVPMRRPIDKRTGRCKTPCETCPKIPPDAPKKTRQHAVEMTDENRRAFEHYLECRAIGRFPDDPLVRRDAAVIRAVFDAVDRQERLEMQQIVIMALSRRGA